MAKKQHDHDRQLLPFHSGEEALRAKNNCCVTEQTLQIQERNFYYQIWKPVHPETREDQKIKAQIIVVHGLHDYGGRFAQFANCFLDSGFEMVVPDNWGHGRSDGIHGYFESVKSIVDAIHEVVVLVKKPSVPTFIMGSSLGGLIVLTYALDYPSTIKGVVAMCPLIRPNVESMPSPLVISVARVIDRFLPTLPIAAGNRGKNHADPQLEKEFADDPRTYSGWIRARSGLAMKEAFDVLEPRIPSFSVPYFIIHGNHDRATDFKSSQHFFDVTALVSNENKKFSIVKDAEHGLMEGPWGPAIREDILSWLESRLLRTD